MLKPIPLLLFLVSYIVFCGIILHFCFFADPENSEMAYFAQIVLPNKLWNRSHKIFGSDVMKVFEKMQDLFMVFVYFFVVLGCWTVVFYYVYPFIDESNYVSDNHKWIGYVVFVACFASWRLANKSKPGFITPQTFRRYDHYPYDDIVFPRGRRCQSTNIIRIPRSKFDRIKYKANIPRYDHFCGWVFNTIGEENYRWFLLFLVVHVVMCTYGFVICFLLFRGEIREKKLLELTFFDRKTGESVESSWFIVLQFLFAQETAVCTVMIIMGVMAIALGGFLGYHVSIFCLCQTWWSHANC